MTPRPTRTRIWRTRITRAILCLLLGAVTTVGVAWGIAWGSRGLHLGYYPAPRHEGWLRPAPGWPAANRCQEFRAFGYTYLLAAYIPETTTRIDIDRVWRQTADHYGWPARALYWHYEQMEGGQQPPPSRWQYGISVEKATPGKRPPESQIPVLPLFPGFVYDTLFFAAPWWLILITPGALKRWRRRRRGRGRCIHCGYDLTGLPAGTVSGGTVLRTVTGADGAQHEDTARRAVPPTCPECGA